MSNRYLEKIAEKEYDKKIKNGEAIRGVGDMTGGASIAINARSINTMLKGKSPSKVNDRLGIGLALGGIATSLYGAHKADQGHKEKLLALKNKYESNKNNG